MLSVLFELLDRTFLTNIPSLEVPRFSTLHELVRELNPNICVECMPPDIQRSLAPQYGTKLFNDHDTIKSLDHNSWYEGSDLWHAVELMRKCLQLDCTKRISAAEALYHPFITVGDNANLTVAVRG